MKLAYRGLFITETSVRRECHTLFMIPLECSIKMIIPYVKRALWFAVSVSLMLPAAFAVETQTLEDESFSDFNQGVSTGTELLALGRLQLGPRPVLQEKSDEGVTWDIAVDPADGTVFYSTGHNGKVFHLQSNGKVEVWADLPEVQATSLAIDPKGGLLIGASPSGKIYRAVEKGKPELFFETGEKYVWDLMFDRNGMLYAATGTNGKVFRIRGERNGEVFYDSDATNVMALNFDSQGTLLAATQGKAYILRITDARNAYILYAASQDELRTLTVDSDGNIYAAANTVRLSSAMDKSTTSSSDFGSSLDGTGIIYQVLPSGYVTSFWTAPEGPILSIVADTQTSSILAAAGKNGKLYRIQVTDSSYSVVADVDEPLVTALARHNDRVLMGTANKAVIYELVTSASQNTGIFASRALNARSTVQWGNLVFDGEVKGDQIAVETRTGNTPEPADGTWSPWTPAVKLAPQIVKPQSPVAQYLQYRLTISSSGDAASGFIDNVQVFYVQKNVPPVIRKIDLAKVPGSPAAAQTLALANAVAQIRDSSSSDNKGGSTASEEAAKAASAAARAAQAAAAPKNSPSQGDLQNSQKVTITWTAEDSNDDKLRYSIFFKGEDESVWKLIEEHLTTNKHQFSTEAIPDGEYRFKVVATDQFDNQETSAATVSLTSRVYTVDNSAPDIAGLSARKTAENTYEISLTASDKTSIISAADYNLNAADEWRTLAPQDGIFDLNSETFLFTVTPEKPQPEHTLSVRVFDREGNSRVEKVLLK